MLGEIFRQIFVIFYFFNYFVMAENYFVVIYFLRFNNIFLIYFKTYQSPLYSVKLMYLLIKHLTLSLNLKMNSNYYLYCENS